MKKRQLSLTCIATSIAIWIAAFFVTAKAQSLAQLKIGGDEASLKALGEPTGSKKVGEYLERDWTLANGNDISVTVSAAGKIVYIESDWNGKSPDTGCDLTWLQFGATTYADLQTHFGSSGFSFLQRPATVDVDDGVVIESSYEAGPYIVTFYSKIGKADAAKATTQEASEKLVDHAWLDAISLADPDYVKTEWGERLTDADYKKPVWK